MQVVDLTKEYEPLYLVCLEDWSEEMKEAGNHKEAWFRRMVDQGLRVKLAFDDTGLLGGMVHYVPIEHSFAEGRGLYFVNCIWVHGHKQGRGNFQKRGLGTALLQAAEDDAMALGARGMAAWGLWLPIWMKASWFKKHGYRQSDRIGIQSLVWKPFTEDARPPRRVRQQKKPQTERGRVVVTALVNGWCPAQNITFERAKRAAAEFGDKVEFRPVYTADRGVFREWGMSDALFIDDKLVRTGPPPTYDSIKKAIARRVARL